MAGSHEVRGSIPLCSTKFSKADPKGFAFLFTVLVLGRVECADGGLSTRSFSAHAPFARVIEEPCMKIAVSSCLLGEPCRYDGKAKPCPALIGALSDRAVVPLCPEVEGGLPTPRLPNEIVVADRALRVVDSAGVDNTEAFLRGAQVGVARALDAGCSLAVLKEKSPSCGCGKVYDGTFSGRLVEGVGVTARCFLDAGVRVVGEDLVVSCVARTAEAAPGAMPALFAGTSSECHAIETARLVLRPLTTDDAKDVFACYSDPDIGFDAGWEPHRSLEDARRFVEQIASSPHVFGIFEKTAPAEGAGEAPLVSFRDERASAHGRCIGSIGLIPDPHRANPDCLMLGYALGKRAWGRGYMTEAARAIIWYGFYELGLPLITCTHFSFNERSRRVIEKCGFAHEGTLHGCERTPDGVLRDIEAYVLYRDAAERA